MMTVGYLQTPTFANNPQWQDLPARMRVEILDNMLPMHGFTTACHLLGLTAKQREEIFKHLNRRNRQIERENTQLAEMRLKQRRALLRIDNSDLKHNSVPPQLVFSKMSERCADTLRKKVKTDYLLCHAGDLLNARRFLHRRGLDRSFAGNWSNSLVALRAPESVTEEEMFEWKGPVAPEKQAPTSEAPLRPYTPTPYANAGTSFKMEKLNQRASFINAAGRALTVNPRELALRKGDPFAQPKWLTDLQRQIQKEKFERHKREHREEEAHRRGLVRLKIGTERAAQIRNLETPRYAARQVYDQPNVFQQSIDFSSWGMSPTKKRFDEIPGMVCRPRFPNDRPSFDEEPQPPARRVMGGRWSYDSIAPHRILQTNSSFRLRQKLEEAKMDAQRERAEQERGRTYSGLPLTPQQIPRPLSASRMLASSRPRPRVGLSSMNERAGNPATNPAYDSFVSDVLNMSSEGQKSETSSALTSTLRHPTPSTHTERGPVAPTVTGKEETDEDRTVEEDEMVLLPNGQQGASSIAGAI